MQFRFRNSNSRRCLPVAQQRSGAFEEVADNPHCGWRDWTLTRPRTSQPTNSRKAMHISQPYRRWHYWGYAASRLNKHNMAQDRWHHAVQRRGRRQTNFSWDSVEGLFLCRGLRPLCGYTLECWARPVRSAQFSGCQRVELPRLCPPRDRFLILGKHERLGAL